MYVPSHFKEADLDRIKTLIRTHDFATVVSWDGTRPIASHLLVELEEDPTGILRLSGHMARGNPQWRTFRPEAEVLTIFQGPHTYISPTWYTVQAVPTWDYLSAHVYGTPRIIDDRNELYRLLERLVKRHEAGTDSTPRYDLASLPADFVDTMMKGVVGFSIAVTGIEASFKLSQNRSAGDFDNIIRELRRRPDGDSHKIAEAMARLRPAKPQE